MNDQNTPPTEAAPQPESPPMKGMDFQWALSEVKQGRRVTRLGWNGPGQFLELQEPDAQSKMTLPYIYISTVQGDLVPWLCSHTDLLSNDWGTLSI